MTTNFTLRPISEDAAAELGAKDGEVYLADAFTP